MSTPLLKVFEYTDWGERDLKKKSSPPGGFRLTPTLRGEHGIVSIEKAEVRGVQYILSFSWLHRFIVKRRINNAKLEVSILF